MAWRNPIEPNTQRRRVKRSAAIGADRRNTELLTTDAKKGASFPIVGMGASAGGLEAFRKFFSGMPADSGMAFVLVQHLDPHRESMLADLLSKFTEMKVTEVEDGMPVVPNHVYLIPPNASMTIDDRRLRLREPAQPRGHRTPIDTFLRSLAEDQGENAVCIILSGTGSDGTLGLTAVKEHGGLTLAGKSSEYDSMPRSAETTGLVDYVLRAEDMPAKLIEYLRHLAKVDQIIGTEPLREEAARDLAKICTILRARTGHDFSGYKQNTVIRRIQRRMQVLQIDIVPKYIEWLHTDAGEAELLFRDLLIGVTQFFRDADAFEALQAKVIPKLFEGKGADDQVRVWVPGCATGEEAYSIAIILREHMNTLPAAPTVQIFATDIDRYALDFARAGQYRHTIASHVASVRLERFFDTQGCFCNVDKSIRDMCIFSAHNVIKDPPFSRLDLISCRNLLIFMNSNIQDRLIPLFHYALHAGGYLFLGSSENVTEHAGLFATLDSKHRIFRQRSTAVRPPVEFPVSAMQKQAPQPTGVAPPSFFKQTASTAESVVRDTYTPPYVVINERFEVVHFSGRTGKYLEPPAGAPNPSLVDMARKGLRLDLRAALHKAVKTRPKIVQQKASVKINGDVQPIELIVQPLPAGEDEAALYLVIFEGERTHEGLEAEVETSELEDTAPVEQLESELRATKEYLRTMTEELETANEELKSSNEELLSTNEELQSSNEELETSKEELQSVNEELQTINAELGSKLDELGRANSDLKNLSESTRIATLFLGSDLRIKSFTLAATDIFNLLESDRGRPATDIVSRLDYDGLQRDVKMVLRTLSVIEREVRIPEGGAIYIMRILPYRTVEDVIEGVVITFVDVTASKRAEEALQNANERVSNILESITDAFISFDHEWRYGYLNDTAAKLLGKPREKLLGKVAWEVSPDIVATPFGAKLRQAKVDNGPVHFEMFYRINNAWYECYCYPSPSGPSVILSDVTERKLEELARRERRERKERLDQVVGLNGGFWDIKFDPANPTTLPDEVDLSPRQKKIIGYEDHEFPGSVSAWRNRILPDDLTHLENAMQEHIEGRTAFFEAEYRINHRDGSICWILSRGNITRNEEGLPVRWTGIDWDITERKRHEEERARLASIVESSAEAIIGVALDGTATSWNAAAERLYGYSAEEMIGRSDSILHPSDRPDEGLQVLERLKRGERVESYETTRVRKDGEHIAVSLTASPINDASGRLVAVSTIAREIRSSGSQKDQV